MLHKMTLYCIHMQAEGKLKGVPICGVGWYYIYKTAVASIYRSRQILSNE